MKVSYVEAIAKHDGPESCGAAREDGLEALTGGRTGWVLRREINALLRKRQVPRDGDAVAKDGRQQRARRHREACLDPARSKTPNTGTGRSHVCLQGRERQTVSGSR